MKELKATLKGLLPIGTKARFAIPGEGRTRGLTPTLDEWRFRDEIEVIAHRAVEGRQLNVFWNDRTTSASTLIQSAFTLE